MNSDQIMVIVAIVIICDIAMNIEKFVQVVSLNLWSILVVGFTQTLIDMVTFENSIQLMSHHEALLAYIMILDNLAAMIFDAVTAIDIHYQEAIHEIEYFDRGPTLLANVPLEHRERLKALSKRIREKCHDNTVKIVKSMNQVYGSRDICLYTTVNKYVERIEECGDRRYPEQTDTCISNVLSDTISAYSRKLPTDYNHMFMMTVLAFGVLAVLLVL